MRAGHVVQGEDEAQVLNPEAVHTAEVSLRSALCNWLCPRVPQGAVFVHGSRSSRHSPRNRYVASMLNDAGLGTLLFDPP